MTLQEIKDHLAETQRKGWNSSTAHMQQVPWLIAEVERLEVQADQQRDLLRIRRERLQEALDEVTRIQEAIADLDLSARTWGGGEEEPSA